MKNGAILLSQGYILTMRDEREAKELKVGSVGVVDGRIVMLSYDTAEAEAQFKGAHPECEVIDCAGCVIMPGLVNTHTHVSMTLMRNYADDMELMDWLNNHIWKFEAKLTEEDIAVGARVGIAEMLLTGCTTFVDMYFSEAAIAREVERMGCRALLTETILDGREGIFIPDMDRLREVAAGCSRVECAVSPHAPYTCSPATLAIARDYAAKYDLPLTIHLSETTAERDIIAERYGMTPTEYLDREGIINSRTILAHCVYLSDSDQEIIASRGASVAHNAESNLKLASGIAPVVKYMREGINCTIGTDGASSNNDLNMWGELRTASLLQRVVESDPTALGAYETLKMATLYGARAIGREDLGHLSEGALADIVVMEMSGVHMRPMHNRVSALVYSANGGEVRDVMVDGVMRVRHHELLGVDLEAEIQEAERRCAAIIERIEKN